MICHLQEEQKTMQLTEATTSLCSATGHQQRKGIEGLSLTRRPRRRSPALSRLFTPLSCAPVAPTVDLCERLHEDEAGMGIEMTSIAKPAKPLEQVPEEISSYMFQTLRMG